MPEWNPDAKSLEDAFFARENAALLEAMRKKAAHEERRDALRQVMPNADDTLLDRLLELGVSAQTVLAIMLLPLARVAWADGVIDAKEREAILKAAEQRDIRPGSASHQLLKSWLDHRPSDSVNAAWKNYISGMWAQLEPHERDEMRERMLILARGVAETAGGFLGMGTISAPEQEVLNEIAATLS
jgi:tellurite resistance protein